MENQKSSATLNNPLQNGLHKSEILFLYEATYNIPNGDPFTGEQRYDEETKKILVSDVRMKRFVRDYLNIKGEEIYLKAKDTTIPDETDESDENTDGDDQITSGETTTDKKGKKTAGKKKEGSGSARRIDELIEKFKNELKAEKEKKKKEKFSEALFVMKNCIDVRLFGGISTKKQDAVNLTGPVQFSLLNPSCNEVNLRMHQNTSQFESGEDKKQGAIGTTTLVPYALIQIHGWVNPKVAEKTGMTASDLKKMFEGLWIGSSGEGSSHSRSKSGQNSILLLEILYQEPNKKIYGVDRLIKITPKNEKKEVQLRSIDDYDWDFSKLFEATNSDKVDKIRYYTEIPEIEKQLSGLNGKVEKITF